MKVPDWIVLAIGSVVSFVLVANAPLRNDLCARPGAVCGTQPGWYTGEESFETLRGVEMGRDFQLGRGFTNVFDYSMLWWVVAALVVWAFVRRTAVAVVAAAILGLTVWLSPTYAGYVLLLATAAAALFEHRHRFRRDQANG